MHYDCTQTKQQMLLHLPEFPPWHHLQMCTSYCPKYASFIPMLLIEILLIIFSRSDPAGRIHACHATPAELLGLCRQQTFCWLPAQKPLPQLLAAYPPCSRSGEALHHTCLQLDLPSHSAVYFISNNPH